MLTRSHCRPRACAVAALSAAIAAAVHLAAQGAGSLTIVKAGRLLDPRTGGIVAPAAVLIERNKIRDVASPTRLERENPTARIVDLGGAMLLPGLIDAHTHLLLDAIVPPEPELDRHANGEFAPALLLAIVESPTRRALLGARLAREDLESGFTTVRNLGHSGIDGDAELRDAINAGRVSGPRILASGRKLIALGSYVQSLNPALAAAILEQEFLLVDGADGARRAVRQNVFRNVDVIKITDGDDVSPAEMAGVVEEAHRQHLKVAVHAGSIGSIQVALDARADSIEHGNEVTDAQLAQMRERGTFFDLTPTFFDGFWTTIHETSTLSPARRAALVNSESGRRARAAALVQRVVGSGVKFAAGSDMGWFYPGKTRGQASIAVLTSLARAGMSRLDLIRAITVNAAEMLGWQDRIGALDPGKYADLVAVGGDPLADATELERVGFVMKDGEVIRNDLTSR